MLRKLLLLLAFVALTATVAFTVVGASRRAEGQRVLADVLARHDAAGYGTSFADLATMAPPVDPDRQLRLRAWMKAPGPRGAFFSVDRDLAWRLVEGAKPDEKVLESHEAFRSDIETLESLLAEGDLCFTSLGWLPADPEATSFSERIGGWIPNLLRMRAAYNWYAVETSLADDATHALTMLQRLHDGLERPGCLIDSMVAVACDAVRDDAMVVLALSGRYPYAWLDAWLDEAPRAPELVAAGLRGERLRFGGPLGRHLAKGGSLRDHLGASFAADDPIEVWNYHLRPWAHGALECATYLEGMVALERHVLGEIERGELDRKLEACEDLGLPYSLMMPNENGTLVSARASTDRHRLVRAAVLIALESAAGGSAPATEAEALAWVADRRPHLLPEEGETPLLYERIADDRFRMAVNLYDEGDPLRRQKPPADRPLDLDHDLVEIQVR